MQIDTNVLFGAPYTIERNTHAPGALVTLQDDAILLYSEIVKQPDGALNLEVWHAVPYPILPVAETEPSGLEPSILEMPDELLDEEITITVEGVEDE